MKTKFYFLLSLFLSVLAYSQSEMKVTLAGTQQKPIPNAQVFCNGKLLGKTNIEGKLNFSTKCKVVEIKLKGYYTEKAVVDKMMEVVMEPENNKSGRIETIILEDKSDAKALEILRKVNEKYKENSPKSLDSYSYKSYERISMDLDSDSITHYSEDNKKRIDSLKNLPERKKLTPKQKKDSLENIRFSKLVGQSKAFIWERALNYLYSNKYGEKTVVLDNKISGLKEPIYEMMTLNTNRNRVPEVIQETNRNQYRFYLTDTIEIEGRKNFVIRFRQVGSKASGSRRKYLGYVYVDQETFAVKKIETNSREQNRATLTSIWVPIQGKWFLSKENLKMRAGKVNKFGYYLYRTSDYFDYETPYNASSKDFKGYNMVVKNSDGSLMDKYRTYNLNEREQNTYIKIDSVGNQYKLHNKAKIFTSLYRGKLRTGNVDWSIFELAKYNQYEGVRITAGGKLNEKFHRYISPDAYVAYGFKDSGWKYGVGIDFKTTLDKNSFFRVEYFDDVVAAGKFNENLWNFKMKIMNSGLDLNNDRFYAYKGFRLSYENDLFNSLTMKVSATKTKETAKFDYEYENFGHSVDNFSTLLTLKYAPKSKNIMTPSGKFTYENSYPEIYFNFEKAFQNLGGAFSYSKFDLLFTHQFKTKLGVTGIRSYSGIIAGKAPIWHHFQLNGLAAGKANSWNFNLTSYLGFATMKAGHYYSDKFTGFYLTHRIPWYFKSFGQSTSSFDLVYRGIIGGMDNMEKHQFEYQTINQLYQELGLEWNNFLSTRFNLGFFYRVGAYRTGNFKEDFAVQFKFKLLGF